jgi:hypothetical protein
MEKLEPRYTLEAYQLNAAMEGLEILKRLNIVYLCMEVRTRKTSVSLEIARRLGAKKVLFSTKLKAIPSIKGDYRDYGFDFPIVVINDESLHKVEDDDFDLVIHDEHHRFGTFPKLNQSATYFKKRFGHLPMIFLSGTPHPESYMQVYHQFYVSHYSPFKAANFYAFFKRNDFLKSFINKTGYKATDWSAKTENVVDQVRSMEYPKEVENNIVEYLEQWNADRLQELMEVIDPYFLRLTQKEAGFESSVQEEILYVRMDDLTYELTRRLIKDRVIESETEDILADTAVKLQQKLHQMFSGTVKFESGRSFTFDYSKAVFIKTYFTGKRIAIYYKFKQELLTLQETFPDLTQNVEDFNNRLTDVIALQFVSGREGVTLSTADCLVAYNIDFSALTYFQFKDRLTTKDRKENKLYWIFAANGIEDRVYEAVESKKSYTVGAFRKQYKVKK